MAKVRGAPPLSRITLLRDRVDDWHTFPFNVRAVATLDELDVRERVLFFVGENGSGKSTLLEAIALSCGFGPEGGTRNLSFTTRVSAAPSIDERTLRRSAFRKRYGYRGRGNGNATASSYARRVFTISRASSIGSSANAEWVGATSLHTAARHYTTAPTASRSSPDFSNASPDEAYFCSMSRRPPYPRHVSSL